MIFGQSEVIRPINGDIMEATLRKYRFGEIKMQIEKKAYSHIVGSKEDVLGHTLPALKHLEAGHFDYLYCEVFTDDHGISRMNICQMGRVK
jgi:hypothetical protein